MSSPRTKYRYPGLKPFSAEEKHIFFGREQDIDQLSKLIRIESPIVLYGKSGLGKSSLLSAGVIPQLEKKIVYIPFDFALGRTALTTCMKL